MLAELIIIVINLYLPFSTCKCISFQKGMCSVLRINNNIKYINI